LFQGWLVVKEGWERAHDGAQPGMAVPHRLSGFAGGDVEALVVEREGRIVLRGGGDERVEEGVVEIGGQLLELFGDTNGGDEGAVRSGVGKRRRSEGEIGLGVIESSVDQAFSGFWRDREMGGGFPVAEVIAEGRLPLQLCDAGIQAREIGAASALSDEPSAGLERAVDADEQSVVVVDPVESGGAEDPISNGFEIQLSHIGAEDLHAIAEPRREKVASAIDHIFGKIAGEDGAFRETLGEFSGEAAGAAAGVENGFVAAQLDAVENLEAPAELWIGDGVVGGGVPLFALVGEHGSMMRESPR
jgi:hypothetical protein